MSKKKSIVLAQRDTWDESGEDRREYLVRKVKNIIEFHVGERLTEKQVEALVSDEEVDVTIERAK